MIFYLLGALVVVIIADANGNSQAARIFLRLMFALLWPLFTLLFLFLFVKCLITGNGEVTVRWR